MLCLSDAGLFHVVVRIAKVYTDPNAEGHREKLCPKLSAYLSEAKVLSFEGAPVQLLLVLAGQLFEISQFGIAEVEQLILSFMVVCNVSEVFILPCIGVFNGEFVDVVSNF